MVMEGDGLLVSAPFLALTVIVYVVLGDRPVKSVEVCGADTVSLVIVPPPSVVSTMYCSMIPLGVVGGSHCRRIVVEFSAAPMKFSG